MVLWRTRFEITGTTVLRTTATVVELLSVFRRIQNPDYDC